MKALPFLLLAAILLSACDSKKLLSVDGGSGGTNGNGEDSSETGVRATPKPATPKPTPKPGDWMWKDYKNPLDTHKKK